MESEGEEERSNQSLSTNNKICIDCFFVYYSTIPKWSTTLLSTYNYLDIKITYLLNIWMAISLRGCRIILKSFKEESP